MYKAGKFEMEPEYDKRKGEIMSRNIEGYQVEKYRMRTEFTMTQYKITVQEVQNIQRYRSFEEYLGCKEYNEVFQLPDNEEIKQGSNFTSIVKESQNDPLSTMMGMSSISKKISKKSINASVWLCK